VSCCLVGACVGPRRLCFCCCRRGRGKTMCWCLGSAQLLAGRLLVLLIQAVGIFAKCELAATHRAGTAEVTQILLFFEDGISEPSEKRDRFERNIRQVLGAACVEACLPGVVKNEIFDIRMILRNIHMGCGSCSFHGLQTSSKMSGEAWKTLQNTTCRGDVALFHCECQLIVS
jgi:hypothetical protein